MTETKGMLTLWVLLLSLSSFAADPGEATTLTVQHVANEGVLIAAGDKSIMIDALFRKHYPQYDALQGEALEKLEQAKGTYQVDVILATHNHLDHFNPHSVSTYLSHQKDAIFVGTEQIVAHIKEKGLLEPIKDQVVAKIPQLKQSTSSYIKGIHVEALGLRHGGRFKKMQNNGYLITMDGHTILHVGDADLSEDNFASFNLSDKRIDLAILPYWYFVNDSGIRVIRNQIKARRLVAAHIPPAHAEMAREKISASFPRALVLTQTGERYNLD